MRQVNTTCLPVIKAKTAMTRHTQRTLARLALLGVSLCLSACQTLPSTPHLDKSLKLSQSAKQHIAAQTGDELSLSSLVKAHTDAHPKLSGYYPIATGANAFAARSILSDMATKTIDVQYYIWHNDEAGQLMLKDLWEAAQRGVKVRLLLDDMNSSAQFDQVLLRLAQHPNIAVRLINPMPYRKFRSVNYLTRPKKVNARMHNKSMTFDNRISVIGGRNIGNEYLNNTITSNFADLDVLLVGSVVQDINQSFEGYWSSPLSFDIETLAKDQNKQLNRLIIPSVFNEFENSKNASSRERALRSYRTAMQDSTIGVDLLQKRLPFRWTKIELFVDPVEKLSNAKDTRTEHIVGKLQRKIGKPNSQFSIISSYFVPTKDGVKTLAVLARNGIKINILTNSFDATDVGIVHAGYAHWRNDLLKSGVNLYEIKSTATSVAAENNKFWRTKSLTSTSLHAKAFAIDDRLVFIGSYNIDPRSANINTELGVLIHDKQLAEQLHQALSDHDAMMRQAYRLKLNPKGRIEWHTIEHDQPKIYRSEPKTSLSDRAGVVLLSWLPIDWLL